MYIKNDVLRAAYNGSYYTIQGAGGDLNEWKNVYAAMLKEREIGDITEWIEFTEKDMNTEFGFTGLNSHPENFQYLAFSLEGLNVGKLAIFKIQMGDRWFDDVVDNYIMCEGEE